MVLKNVERKDTFVRGAESSRVCLNFADSSAFPNVTVTKILGDYTQMSTNFCNMIIQVHTLLLK